MVLFSVLFGTGVQAQNPDPSGIYYLQGVMETASGFKLNPDSTFEFFFSQGALDRTGKGIWQINNNRVKFVTPGKVTAGFVLLKSEHRSGSEIKVVIKEENTMLAGFVHARLIQETESRFLPADEALSFSWKDADFTEIELLFELCQDRTYTFKPQNAGDNYFEFAIDRTICDVYFAGLELIFDKNSLTGPHPILVGEHFSYTKE